MQEVEQQVYRAEVYRRLAHPLVNVTLDYLPLHKDGPMYSLVIGGLDAHGASCTLLTLVMTPAQMAELLIGKSTDVIGADRIFPSRDTLGKLNDSLYLDATYCLVPQCIIEE